MFDCFSTVAAGIERPMDAASELQERGFIVLPGPVPAGRMARLADVYTAAAASATSDDTRIGSTSTRVSDVPGSHRWSGTPDDTVSDLRAEHDGQVLACGGAGSLLVFNGSAWHGHTENISSGPRRSLQGAFIPRDGRAATDFAARMQPETRARLGQLAPYVLAL